LCADALDVFVDGRERVWVVDVGAWGGVTDSGLWSWEDIVKLDTEGRLAADEAAVDEDGEPAAVLTQTHAFPIRVRSRPSVHPDPLQAHRLPLEIVELAGLLSTGISLEDALQAPSALPTDLSSAAGVAAAVHTVIDSLPTEQH
jgi:D123